MQRILIVDGRRMIGDSIKMQIMIEEDEDLYDVTSCAPENTDELKANIQGKYFDFVLVEHDMFTDVCSPKNFGGVKVFGYSSEKKNLDNFDRYKIPYMGIANKSEELLQIIERVSQGRIPAETARESVEKPVKAAVVTNDDDEEEEVSAPPPVVGVSASVGSSVGSSVGAAAGAVVGSVLDTNKGTAQDNKQAAPKAEANIREEQETKEIAEERPRMVPNGRSNERVKEFNLTSYRDYEDKPHEIHEPKHETRVISVYSAKGGVGKSTLSVNLALFLSMMDHGRDKYKVCLVDYNIESGDVRTMLGFKGEKIVDMGIWAEDIHQQLVHHANPDDIIFTREQIYRYLEPYHDKTGLYVLLAPQLHENAQFIEANEIKVMLDNIIKYGGFDFVICDTADNTSDSSYYALEASDTVLLVCTQDVTTATRNDSVLRSLKHTGMDMSKFRLIINNVTSKRKSGVSVSEIESYFNGYECVGRVHENTSVLHANNYASPLVLKPKNAFTEDIKNVVLYLLNNKGTDEKPARKGLFKRK